MNFFTKFMFCISLETGAYIIGWTNIILSFLACIFCTSTLSILAVTIESNDEASEVFKEYGVNSLEGTLFDDGYVQKVEAQKFTLSRF